MRNQQSVISIQQNKQTFGRSLDALLGFLLHRLPPNICFTDKFHRLLISD